VRPYLEKKPSQKRAGGMAQGVGPEFKSHYHTHTKSIFKDRYIHACSPSTQEAKVKG
jgi:hypothetical protein